MFLRRYIYIVNRYKASDILKHWSRTFYCPYSPTKTFRSRHCVRLVIGAERRSSYARTRYMRVLLFNTKRTVFSYIHFSRFYVFSYALARLRPALSTSDVTVKRSLRPRNSQSQRVTVGYTGPRAVIATRQIQISPTLWGFPQSFLACNPRSVRAYRRCMYAERGAAFG